MQSSRETKLKVRGRQDLQLLHHVLALLPNAHVSDDAAHLGHHRLHHAQLIVVPRLYGSALSLHSQFQTVVQQAASTVSLLRLDVTDAVRIWQTSTQVLHLATPTAVFTAHCTLLQHQGCFVMLLT